MDGKGILCQKDGRDETKVIAKQETVEDDGIVKRQSKGCASSERYLSSCRRYLLYASGPPLNVESL